MEPSEHAFQKLIRSKYHQTSKYIIENLYFFSHDWESDMFIVKNNGYIYEIEIKISVSDFKADLKKTKKHQSLQSGNFIPNKFFYCIPEAIKDQVTLPKYAGLLTVSEFGSIKTAKEAPFLHKDKIEVESNIAQKLYRRWRTEVINNRQLKQDMKYLRESIGKPNLFN